MALDVFLINNFVELCSLILLLGAAYISSKLMFDDKKSSWNLISMAIGFIALSIGFSILHKSIKVDIFGVLEGLFRMMGALIFLAVLWVAKKQKDGLK